MDFVFGFSKDDRKNNGILVLIERFIKMVHLVAFPGSTTIHIFDRVLIDRCFNYTGNPVNSYLTLTLGLRRIW